MYERKYHEFGTNCTSSQGLIQNKDNPINDLTELDNCQSFFTDEMLFTEPFPHQTQEKEIFYTDHAYFEHSLQIIDCFPSEINNKCLFETPDEKNEPIHKKRIRSSAAKRYPQHIIVGFGRWFKREFGDKDKEMVQFINSDILGKKQGHKYKISKVKEIKELFAIDEKDDDEKKRIKTFLKENFHRFWDEGFDKWLEEDFKGDEMSKTWLFKNKELLRQKITGNKSKYPQFKNVPLIKNSSNKINVKYLNPVVEK